MKQQRLNSVVVTNVHMKETKALSIATLIDDFVFQTSVRKNSFYSTEQWPDVQAIHCFIRIFSPLIYFFNLLTIDKQADLIFMAFVKNIYLQI